MRLHFTLLSEPRKGLAACSAKGVSIGLALVIEPVTHPLYTQVLFQLS